MNGSPSGAGSALFVTRDGKCQIYGCSTPTGGCSPVNIGECISFPDGTYVSCEYFSAMVKLRDAHLSTADC